MAAKQSTEKIMQMGRMLRIHLILFAAVGIALFTIDISFFDTRWFHWPVMAWGVIVGVHALYFKCLTVDDEWVSHRTDRIRSKSYDLGHIRDIEDSLEKRQSSEGSEAETRN